MIVCPDCRAPIKRIVFMEIGECADHGYVRWQSEPAEDATEVDNDD